MIGVKIENIISLWLVIEIIQNKNKDTYNIVLLLFNFLIVQFLLTIAILIFIILMTLKIMIKYITNNISINDIYTDNKSPWF